MFLQAPHYAEWTPEAEACWDEDAPLDGPPVSLAVVGRVGADGVSRIVGTAESPLPPSGAPPATAEGWSLTVLAPDGAPLHQVALKLEDLGGHDHGRPEGRVWRTRLPLAVTQDATLLLRGTRGQVRGEHSLRVLR